MNYAAVFNYEVFEDPTEYATHLTQVAEGATLAAIDLETTGMDPHAELRWNGELRHAFIVSISVTVHSPAGEWTGVLPYPEPEALVRIMEALDSVPTVVAHNALYEMQWLQAVTGRFPRVTDDTLLMAKCWHGAAHSGLKPLVIQLYGHDYGIDVRPSFLQKALQKDAEEVWRYNALDTAYTARLYRDVSAAMTPREMRVYREAFLPAIPVLAELNTCGLAVDQELAAEVTGELEAAVEAAEARFAALVPPREDGKAWNPNSSRQLSELFYEVLELPVQTNARGNPSTDKNVLAEMDHPAAAALLALREALNMLNKTRTYGSYERLPAIYGFGTQTGRLSCHSENAQQIPRNKRVRGIFTAAPGNLLVVADYSQVELRLAAAISGDAGMLQAYRGDRKADLHTATARRVLGVTGEVEKAARSSAKAINFGFLYGMGARSFRSYARTAYEMELSEDEAAAMRRSFFEAYPGLLTWHQRVRDELAANASGDITGITLATGHCLAWDGYAKGRGRVERQAINAAVQGVAAVLLYRALVSADRMIQTGFAGEARLVATVHDSMLYEVAEDAVDDFIPALQDVMEDAEALLEPLGTGPLGIPLLAEVKADTHWVDD